jgi:hypothetical protein
MTNNTIIFEMATQFKYRYPYKGMITTEDLWDLSLSQLDTVYKSLAKELKTTEEDSLLVTTSVNDAVKANELKSKIEVVKYIFHAKQQAAELNRMAAANAAEKQRIMGVLADMEDNALRNMSKEELLKRLSELG